ncbi:flagellar filament capping protein FliD [Thalassotalea sp. G2M2-11]|uniref:flagellar filament capping protein FliD n=1 Tax=Thalassotalea sp. G2M2-11 TaxID=2787627 RepID=UPI0019D1B457|nr:flagellar filament capping protein FliD [Thalassotalea sp. G2M2-11]
MNITSAGIGSGLDLEGIIEAYINAEAIPTEIRLQEKEDRLRTEISGVGAFKSALSTFESVLKKLSETTDFNKQTIDTSTEDISVTTNGFASNGSFSIEVEQLAQGSRVESAKTFTAASDTVGSGTLTFGVGADSFDITVDAADTLSVIRDKINEHADNFGVVANVISTDSGTFLSYSSEITGDTNDLSVTSTGTLDSISNAGATQVQAASSAIIWVDGNKITKDSNEFKNVIEDVTITANKVNMGSPSTLTIAQDEENGKNLITEFVDGYNALVNTMTSLSNPESGALAFDPNIRQMKQQLNSIISDTVSGLSGSIDSLDDIGITVTKSGLLEVSSFGIGTLPSGVEKRDSALETKLNEIGELFASSDGVSIQMRDLIASYNDSDGSLTKRQTLLNQNLSGIDDEYQALEDKLRNYEDTLRRKFTFLDSTVAQYNATSDWLTSALVLPKKKD